MQFGGCTYWSVKDPIALKYFQLREEEFFLLNAASESRTLAEIKAEFEAEYAPRKISTGQLASFYGTLHGQGLAISESDGQADTLLDRRHATIQQQWLERIAGILAIRFRGVNPDRFLTALEPWCGWFFTPVAAFCVALLCLSAVMLVLTEFDTLRSRLPELRTFFDAGNLPFLFVTIAFTKVLHELGHGIAHRKFGGRSHELGLMLLVFTPCLYVNVSDAWMMPSRWRRAAIAAAGMYVELTLAAICTFIWWASEPGLLNTLCLNVMVVCSVSTVLFNGNPLLRYDGYFILADMLETPNLFQQAESVVGSAFSRWVLGCAERRLLTPVISQQSRLGIARLILV